MFGLDDAVALSPKLLAIFGDDAVKAMAGPTGRVISHSIGAAVSGAAIVWDGVGISRELDRLGAEDEDSVQLRKLADKLEEQVRRVEKEMDEGGDGKKTG